MKKRLRYAAAILSAAALLLMPVSVPAAEPADEQNPEETAAQYPVSDTLTPGGIVELKGGELEEGAFTFVVMDEENQVLQTVTNSEEGGINFEPITYTLNEPASEPLTYTYTVRQLESNDPDVTIDTTVYTFAVVVTDQQDGTLEIWASEGWNSLDFTNTLKESGKEETTPAADPEEENGNRSDSGKAGIKRKAAAAGPLPKKMKAPANPTNPPKPKTPEPVTRQILPSGSCCPEPPWLSSAQ
jgi:pilin isopeptide linkage protein